MIKYIEIVQNFKSYYAYDPGVGDIRGVNNPIYFKQHFIYNVEHQYIP